MNRLERWMESDPSLDPSGARGGCLLALGVCFLGWGALLLCVMWMGWL
jgi:hypothetical protein